jgi:hypothetical protein
MQFAIYRHNGGALITGKSCGMFAAGSIGIHHIGLREFDQRL